MSHNTLEVLVYNTPDIKLIDYINEYAPVYWELYPEFQVHTVEEFRDILINDVLASNQVILVSQNNVILGLLSSVFPVKSLHYSGTVCYIQHVCSITDSTTRLLYSTLLKQLRRLRVNWIATYTPKLSTNTALIKYKNILEVS